MAYELPTEIVIQILILSANLFDSAHYYNLCLVHPKLYQVLKTNSFLGKFGTFARRPDRLFYHPVYKYWIESDVLAAELVILRLLTCEQSYWKFKLEEEITKGFSNTLVPAIGRDIKIPDNILEADVGYWKRTEGCGHRTLNLFIQTNMVRAARYMIKELGALKTFIGKWVCDIPGCRKAYNGRSGLRYHRQTIHKLFGTPPNLMHTTFELQICRGTKGKSFLESVRSLTALNAYQAE